MFPLRKKLGMTFPQLKKLGATSPQLKKLGMMFPHLMKFPLMNLLMLFQLIQNIGHWTTPPKKVRRLLYVETFHNGSVNLNEDV